MTDVRGNCPACGEASLFLSEGGPNLGEAGHVFCSNLDCPSPGAVDDLLKGGENTLYRLLGGGRQAQIAAHTLSFHGCSPADVRRMTDRQLLDVPGIGEATLAHVRRAFPPPEGEKVHPHPECPANSRMTPNSPSVEIINALSERLDQLSEQPTVFVGGRDSRLLIDGNFYAVSSEHPVVLDPFGSGIPGGRLTLTLNCDRITVDGKEVGDA
ncbi:hypothetical protein [Streptomyces sp. NPDC060188]|uniref:hypothetical protein n=1 Tax=Streptomyces sp. NPDC060188 TaxID=3347068 RepID=UPI00364B1D6E